MPQPPVRTVPHGNRRLALQTLGLAAASLSPWSALAQNSLLPVEQVKILCGFPAGGTADTTSRRVGDKLAGSTYTRNPAVVENKTGAGGRIAIEAVKNAAPDGSTLLLSAYSMLLIYPHIYRRLPYDPFKDFAPVAMASVLSHGLAVGPMVPASVKTVKDFVAWCKAHPDRASYASPAAGSTPHFLGALLSLNTGVAMTHVAYRGSVPGVSDLIGGQIAAMFTPHGDFLANHRAGKLRLLATSGKSRSPFVPEVATFAEQGFPELTVEEWFGFFAPAKTPASVVAAANSAINQSLKDKGLLDSLALQGLLPLGGSSDDMAKDMRRQFDYWGPVVKRIGFTADS
ncbi:MAG: Bug family tripartite tricarboxylate transporter substrate binding protein [Burkholderiaceae bacterium]|jgi:tripartite-type tricarboxylate transporter receptor subunit TctC|nr:Bug family tripartite tricarboxylate transporter substrate binding protein [Burkholderiaceae bacterium]